MSVDIRKLALQSSSRIGVVNRAEPAVRFIRAVREFNQSHGTSLKTVVFHLDEEAEAVFVREADEAVPFRSVPGATQTGSVYLDKQALVSALGVGQCDAVWPGWGFVSEDAEFATLVAGQGLVFLGPDADAMGLLGDKIAAKDLAERSGVPILPWSKREIVDLEDARICAEQIGYPVIVKAAHAGGGRGIRFVMSPEELATQFESARDETRRVTGDEIVFIERLVQRGRHLEVQCLCDRHGNVHTFGVRDCSVQRRNQKIIEETPPPGMSDHQVGEIEAAAARLMKAAKYESAGTVEFLYDLDRDEYYFMEVNTRLQVEHPITEILYGIDLVGGQIDVAFGNELKIPGRTPSGWVMEARLNAEDPERDFTPAPGFVRQFRAPAGPGVRVDSGIEEGSTIPSLFDSMVAKVIAYGSTRSQTIGRLHRALQDTRVIIDGGTTNKAFVLDLLDREEVQAGAVHTKYVEEWLDSASGPSRPLAWAALVASSISSYNNAEIAALTQFRQQITTLGYPRSIDPTGRHEVTLGYDGNSYAFDVRRVGRTTYQIKVGDHAVSAEYSCTNVDARLAVGDERYSIQIIPRGDTLQCEVDGVPYSVELESGGAVKAPSPAVVLAVSVKPGDAVEPGDRLLSLEAMKMEMIIEAPVTAVIGDVLVAAGQQVAAGDPLLLLDTQEQDDQPRVSTAPIIEFPTPPDDPQSLWAFTAESFEALFLGYDRAADAESELKTLVKLAGPSNPESLFYLIFRALQKYVTIQSLFSSEHIASEQFARTSTWQELMYICYRYDMHGSDALPEQFSAALEGALGLYPGSGSSAAWSAFFHMERSRRHGKSLDSIIRTMVLTLENLPIPAGKSDSVLQVIGRVVRLNQVSNPSLADAAQHARYHLYDRVAVKGIRRRRAERTRERLKPLLDLDQSDPKRQKTEQAIVDASPYVVSELIDSFRRNEGRPRHEILALLARYMTRDREPVNVEIQESNGVPVAIARGQSRTAKTTVVVVDINGDLTPAKLNSIVETSLATLPELILLRSCGQDDNVPAVLETYASTELPVAWLAVGVYAGDPPAEYRTFEAVDGTWQENRRKRAFSPILYRELRVERFARFDLEILYHSDVVYLIGAKAKDNPRDERLFALGAASESEPELNSAGFIERVTEFDEVFMEAVFKMRAEQARRPRRLFWNRIVIHIRALVLASASQIKEYGNRIVPRAQELGLEKAIIYTRRKRWSEDVVRELELLFLNISGDHFTLRSRKPSTELLKPMDRYVSSVVRSRQRNNVYPYELVKMITFTGYPVSLNVPRGEFEEFDLSVTDGNQKTVSVKGRDYGQNESNVVFGIVRNQDTRTEIVYRRVLILSDSTRDMGSLAEPECRRIIAALELAKERRLPVEWVPISSGARIDMDSGTENLDWTAAVLREIVGFTQSGGEINVIVAGINVGAQSYWNAEATMLMHTRGLLIMTDDASMLLTGKKALDFSGSVSADTNVDIGGVERIMGPNGQAQHWVPTLSDAYRVLFDHYRFTFRQPGKDIQVSTNDPHDRDVGAVSYQDRLGQGFSTIGDIFSVAHNPERKKPFDMRQVMGAVIDSDAGYLERWGTMRDAETAITWETRLGGVGVGLIGIESRALARLSDIPHDGPEKWSGGTLFPQSSKKVARAISSWSDRVPVVVLANLSGFDGSPESLRKLQLEYGAEIGRGVVNFKGPIVFVVVARYHGGAYVVFSKSLNPGLKAFALEGSYASVLGGAPAAAVVFPRVVQANVEKDDRYQAAQERLSQDPEFSQREFDDVYRTIYAEKQGELGREFDSIHNIERARSVGSIDEIITISELRPRLIEAIKDQ